VGKLASIGYGVENTYSVIKQPLIFWQCIQVLEILHAALGIVKSSVITTFVQVASRIIILLAIVYRVPEVQGSIFFTTLVVAWSLAEIPRYLHYALSLTGGRTTVATWLRYSGFLILYPLGAGSEMMLLYKAMPYIRERGLWSLTLPNKLNFAFDFYKVCWVLLLLYLPVSWLFFAHKQSVNF